MKQYFSSRRWIHETILW